MITTNLILFYFNFAGSSLFGKYLLSHGDLHSTSSWRNTLTVYDVIKILSTFVRKE